MGFGVEQVVFEAAVGVEQGDEVARAGGEPLLEALGVQAKNSVEEFTDEEFVHERKNLIGIGVGEVIEEPFALRDVAFPADGLAEPILITGALPIGEVLFGDAGVALFVEPGNDLGVSSALVAWC